MPSPAAPAFGAAPDPRALSRPPLPPAARPMLRHALSGIPAAGLARFPASPGRAARQSPQAPPAIRHCHCPYSEGSNKSLICAVVYLTTTPDGAGAPLLPPPPESPHPIPPEAMPTSLL